MITTRWAKEMDERSKERKEGITEKKVLTKTNKTQKKTEENNYISKPSQRVQRFHVRTDVFLGFFTM